MLEKLTEKFSRSGALLEQDRRLIEGAATLRNVSARQDVVREGQAPTAVHVLLAGQTYRYKMLPSGGRQITAILVPGDTCDLHGLLLKALDHSVMSLTECTFGIIPRATVLEWIETQPRIIRALWWSMMADEAILREWITNLGRHDARQRIAHLFCQLLVRQRAVGLAQENSYEFALTQEELADMTGLSTVHVNRTLQDLRADGLIRLRDKRIKILDDLRLREVGEFEPGYLAL